MKFKDKEQAMSSTRIFQKFFLIFLAVCGILLLSGCPVNTDDDDEGGGVSVTGGTFTMSDGKISGNTASSSNSSSSRGGGVYVDNTVTFTKEVRGTIYGSDAGDALKNTADSGDSYGHAVCVGIVPVKKRNSTAGVNVTMDSTKDGSDGGWE